MASGETKALRSDAAANRERLLAAAAVAVTRQGEKVPMATIAADAGVGIGTLYRHYPTRSALLAALSRRAFALVLDHARAAAEDGGSAVEAIGAFLDHVIADRDDLILPLHGGPTVQGGATMALQTEIRKTLGTILRRGRVDGTVGRDVFAADIIIAGAMLAQPLPHVVDWDQVARRQARIFLAGLAGASFSETRR